MQTTQIPVRRKVIAGIEAVLGAGGVASVLWPLSRSCAGWPLGQSCEAWFILGVNIFAPVGVAALISAVWTLRSPGRAPHIILGAVLAVVIGRVAFYALRA